MKLLFTVLATTLCLYTNAQVTLPRIKYDKIQLEKEGGLVKRKAFLKSDQLIAEIHYRSNGETKYLCGEKHYPLDSIVIIRGDTTIQYQFLDAASRIEKTTWYQKQNKAMVEYFFPNGKLSERSYQAVSSNNVQPSGIALDFCSASQTAIGEHVEYDENGKELRYVNYESGEMRSPNDPAAKLPNEQMHRLRDKANALVKTSYGDAFFKKHLVLDYNKTAIYDEHSNSYDKNQGMPDRNVFTSWFYRRSDKINYMDFSYRMVLNAATSIENFIIIRLDASGKLIEAIDHSTVDEHNFSEGLLSTNCNEKWIEPDALIKTLQSKGLKVDAASAEITLSWIPDKPLQAKGRLVYKVIANKYPRRAPACAVFYYYDEILVNACSGEITDKGERKFSECQTMSSYSAREQQNGKYGFRSDNGTAIPFEYDELPQTIQVCNIARKDGRYGCIDQQNNIILPFEYDAVTYVPFTKARYRGEYMIVKKGEKYGLADERGQILIPVSYSKLELKSDDEIVAYNSAKVVTSYNFKTKTKKSL
jgi:hypothetical protein